MGADSLVAMQLALHYRGVHLHPRRILGLLWLTC